MRVRTLLLVGLAVVLAGGACGGSVSPESTPTPSPTPTLSPIPTGTPRVIHESRKLTASDAAEWDKFGWSVSVSRDTAVVGAGLDDGAAGSAYVFQRDRGGPEHWGQVAKLTAFDAAAKDYFGKSVSLSDDMLIIGADGDDDAGTDAGSVHVFYRNLRGSDRWGLVGKFIASDGAANDRLGGSVSVSGDIAVVGAPLDDDAGINSGSAYVLQRNRGGPDNWALVAKLTGADTSVDDNFGESVSVSGDVVVVGAPYADRIRWTGSAYVFHRNQGGADKWGQVAKLTIPDAEENDMFGSPVSVSGDVAVIGAAGDDNSAGSAYVFHRNQGGADKWGQVAKITDPDAHALDFFGDCLSVSEDNAAIGAPGFGTVPGLVHVFHRNQGGADKWGQVATLSSSDAVRGDWFGTSVSVSGAIVVVGAPGDDDEADNSGSAYVFDLAGGVTLQ